jgi:LAS seventeen-binding protein 5
VTEKDVEEVQQGLEAAHVSGLEVQRLQEKQRAAVQRAVRQRSRPEDDLPGSPIHPDLHDLSFGALGPEHRYASRVLVQPLIHRHPNRNLQPPIRPTAHLPDEDQVFRRGSLSDFSDYESSDEEAHARAAQTSGGIARKAYINVSGDDEGPVDDAARRHIPEDEDPFADPFAD